jgi:mono/diheme cytochrome c family protein
MLDPVMRGTFLLAAVSRAAVDRRRSLLALVGSSAMAMTLAACTVEPDAERSKAGRLAVGAGIYERHCASCHGANLEGQPNWRERLANGRLPAPPHDASGPTWHHADQVLFDLIKQGVATYAGGGYESDMPAYAGRLSDDEIRAVLAFIKSRWPAQIRDKQAQIDAAQRAR